MKRATDLGRALYSRCGGPLQLAQCSQGDQYGLQYVRNGFTQLLTVADACQQ